MMSICKEFRSNRKQRVVVDGATVSGSQSLAFHREVYHLYQFYFSLLDNKLYAYADDSKLLAVVRKPAGRLAGAASLNMDLARIQEWCNYWCMTLNPNQNMDLVVS